MTGQLDVNTLAAWSAVVAAIVGAFGVHRKATRWFDSVENRFKDQADDISDVRKDLKEVAAQLKPNGGSSHHDVLRREIREAVEDVAPRRRRSRVR